MVERIDKGVVENGMEVLIESANIRWWNVNMFWVDIHGDRHTQTYT